MKRRAVTSRPGRDERGYRVLAGAGAVIRADVVDVWVVKARRAGGWELLQLRRAREPLARTWQPVMGHIEPGETAVAAAVREAREEIGLDVRGRAALAFWALEQLHPFFIAAINAVVLSPRFAVRVGPRWEPTLNAEHDAHRWVRATPASVRAAFMWPGQWAAAAEIVAVLRRPGTLERLRVTAS